MGIKLKLDFAHGGDTKEVLVDETMLNQYKAEYLKEYTERMHWWTLSGKEGDFWVGLNSRMFGEISFFNKNLSYSPAFEEHVLSLNPELPSFTYHTWISMDGYVKNNFETQIREEIVKRKGHILEFKPRMRMQTYPYKEEQVVFFVSQYANREDGMYAVPCEEAIQLNLCYYEGKNIYEGDSIWDEMYSFRIKDESFDISQYETIKVNCVTYEVSNNA